MTGNIRVQSLIKHSVLMPDPGCRHAGQGGCSCHRRACKGNDQVSHCCTASEVLSATSKAIMHEAVVTLEGA